MNVEGIDTVGSRILLVDDEAAILFGFKKLLQCDDVKVDTAETFETALNLLGAHEYQFVITDLKLSGSSGGSGFGIIRHVKTTSPNTQVILITGYGNQEIMEKAFSMGAAGYYEKPVSAHTLRDALKELGM